MKRIFAVFVFKSKELGRNNEDVSVFSARVTFSFIFILNVLTVLHIIFGREWILNIIPDNKGTSRLYFCIIMVIAYLLLMVVYPKRKILSVQLETTEIRKIFRWLLVYWMLSILGLALVIYFRTGGAL